MLGSLATQQLFASANSIAVIPQVYAEWNYNAFLQPSIVSSTSATQILPTAFNSTASWTTLGMNNSGIINGSISQTASGYGIKTVQDPSASALSFKILSKLENNTGSAQGNIASSFKSNKVYLNNTDDGNFYKISFYVKTTGVSYTDGFPSAIVASATPATSGTSSYYYRVVGIGSSGQTIGPDLAGNSDLVLAQSTLTGSVTLRWNYDPKAVSYQIYRSLNDLTSTAYRTTTSSNVYVDDFSPCVSEAYAPEAVGAHITCVPTIEAYNSSASLIPTSYFIKCSNLTNGKLERDTTSIESYSDTWRKVEIWFGTPSDSTITIDAIALKLDLFSDYEKAQMLVDNISMYKITEHDFYLNDYYPAESAFLPLRPGEALMNPLLPQSDRSVSTSISVPVTKPAVFGIKSPQIYFPDSITFPQAQILPSIYDKFKYYISDTSEKSIQAQYDQYMSINKIVLKYVTTFSTINSGSITIYSGSSNTASVISLSSSAFNDSGITVLYYNSGSWSTSSWTAPPQLTDTGALPSVMNDVRGISFKAGSTTTRSTYSSGYVDDGDFEKIHIVEFSPRLELDLSPVLLNYSITKDLTSPISNGFPFSYISSNNGTLSFSNIPFYQIGGYGATIFENRSKNATFYNLMRQGIKFTGFLKSPTFQQDLTENVPQFVMYSDTWSVNDIGEVSVVAFDITKIFAQYSEAIQYSSQRSSLYQIIKTLLNNAGFSDYDLDSLKNVTMTTTKTSNFWTDESKTVFENLQDLFATHQIGAFVDEYGILRFRSLAQTFNIFNDSSYVADFAVTDMSSSANSGIGSANYIANIIPDTYKEDINQKFGKVVARFQIAKNFNSVDENSKNSTQSQVYNEFTDSKKTVWSEKEHTGLSSFQLYKSFNINNNYLYVKPEQLFGPNPRQYLQGFEGDLFIGREIVGYSGLEYVFYPENKPSINVVKIVKSLADIEEGIAQVKTLSPLNTETIQYNTTGRIFGIQRGKYGTPIENHKIVKDITLTQEFDFYRYGEGDTVAQSSIGNFCNGDTEGLHLSLKTKDEYVMISPKEKNKNYNFFAVDFQVPVSGDDGKPANSKWVKTTYKYTKKGKVKMKNGKPVVKTKGYTDRASLALGIFLNMNPTLVKGADNQSSTLFVEISLEQKGNNTSKYYLSIYNQNKSIVNNVPIDSVFDGSWSSVSKTPVGTHRLSVYANGPYIKVAIDNNLVGQYSVDYNIAPGSSYGFYAKSLEDQDATVNLYEIYADYATGSNSRAIPAKEYDMEPRYFFTSKHYLNNIVKGVSNSNYGYLFQTFPQVRGFKIYDIKHEVSPIHPDTAYIYPHMYGTVSQSGNSNAALDLLGPVLESDIQKSDIFATPFRSKFAVVNNTNELVLLNSAYDQTVNPLQIMSKYQELMAEQTIERVLDPNYASNSMEIQTQWLASTTDVEKLLDLLTKSADSFYTSINVSVFGNPLIQTGDFAKITYSLKRVGYDPGDTTVTPLNCLVTSVTQSFSEGVENTSLTLKPLIIS